ncbi:MAG TPA: ATP-binding cassette domain-containing protein [Clostridia bacterium]|nr:ATP-binding cassette domain-containing protein [Clostridia bacterium]
MSGALLSVQNLSVSLAATGAILSPEVDFTLDAGAALALIGDSGCGKTLCINAILGLLNNRVFRVSGHAALGGQNLLGLPECEMRRIRGGKIALIPQNPMTAFDPSAKIGMQLSETVRAHRRIPRAGARELGVRALEALGLPANIMGAYPHTLSGGMLQRIAIALALILEPELIIADEATTALDVVNRRLVLEELLKLKTRGAALLLITHHEREAEYCGCEMLRIGGAGHDD